MPEKKKLTLLIDSREKVPLDFSACSEFSEIKYQKIEAGDYALDGYQHLVSIERKHSLNELLGNLYTRTALDRFLREINRMPKHRFILVECEFEDLWEPSNFYINVLAGYRKNGHDGKPRRGRALHPDVPRMIVLRRLTEFMINFDVKVLFVGHRAVEAIKTILLEVAANHPPQPNN